jgi:iron-sulfur cluster insertion protein
MIELSSDALERFRALAEKHDRVAHGVRIRVMAGGCCGFCYDLDFEAEPRPGDIIANVDGLDIWVDPASHELLRDLRIEYVVNPRTEGFSFVNPVAKEVCGCGTSFLI